MSKKLFLMISFVLLTALTGSALALDIVWTNGSGNGLWNDANNWSPATVPSLATLDKAKVVRLAPNDAHINAGMDANCQWLAIGDTVSGELHMTGGTLKVGAGGSWFILAYGSSDIGIFTLDGGTVTTTDHVFVGFQGQGTVVMNGGTMNIGGTFGIGFNDTGATTGIGYVYLNGGIINVTGTGGILMSSPTGCIGQLDITSGTLTITGDRRAIVNGYITNGWITAYGGLGNVIVTYGSGKTTLTGFMDTTHARGPYPTNNAVNVFPYVTLAWMPGDSAATHDIYFGTDAASVLSATPSTPGIYKGSQPRDANSYGPISLELGTKYYWRIDEVNGPNIVKGDVWTFSTILGLAKSPDPINGATNVALDVVLRWTAGYSAASHDIYFGTDANSVRDANTSTVGIYQGSQPRDANSYGPMSLELDQKYYWRIDEVNDPNVYKGNVWTFTAISGLAQNPNPADSGMNAALDVVLYWAAGYGAVSHDVYFGTDMNGVENAERFIVSDLDESGQVDYNDLFILTNYWLQDPAGSEPYAGVNDDNIVDFTDFSLLADNWMGQSPYFKGNTNDTNYDDPCNLQLNSTYYWRVDEINGQENRKGNVWSFTTIPADSNYTLVGKIMCGYQGWFNCPADGTPRGWVHWGRSGFAPTNCTVDMWPDMNEMDTDEKYAATEFYDGNDYYVFSSHNQDTVLRHFKWMRQYGIDGVYLQRFATELTLGSAELNHRNDVLSYCKEGANMYGRKYAVMYDLSGLGAGGTSTVIDDWKSLVDTMRVGRDPNDRGYMFHKGKPVVAVWGIGFSGRAYTHAECQTLIDFLKNDPNYGGNTVVVGVKDSWRTSTDPNIIAIRNMADVISPWTVGGYKTTSEVNSYASNKWVPDKTWCNTNGKDYLPVIWPGYSFHNAGGGTLNKTPRRGGQLLWDQVKATISTVGTNMLYVAMFDEVDEGTAIFKISNNPPFPGGDRMFVTFDMDAGYPALPGDEYLWLTGQAGRALRGEMSPVPATRPSR